MLPSAGGAIGCLCAVCSDPHVLAQAEHGRWLPLREALNRRDRAAAIAAAGDEARGGEEPASLPDAPAGRPAGGEGDMDGPEPPPPRRASSGFAAATAAPSVPASYWGAAGVSGAGSEQTASTCELFTPVGR